MTKRLVWWLGWAWCCGEELERKWDTCYLFWQRNCWAVGAGMRRQLVIIVMMMTERWCQYQQQYPGTPESSSLLLSRHYHTHSQNLPPLQDVAIIRNMTTSIWSNVTHPIKSNPGLGMVVLLQQAGFLPFVPRNLDLIELVHNELNHFSLNDIPTSLGAAGQWTTTCIL